MMLVDGKPVQAPHFSPAAERNKQAILQALQLLLPARGVALEIASGTGQHVAWFAAALPQWHWQPSDADDAAFATLVANTVGAGLPNMRAPLVVDVLAPGVWHQDTSPLGHGLFDAMYCANMLHIAPWPACTGLMQGAAARLTPTGQLLVYGPFFEDGVATAASNTDFDHSLRQRHPDWGIRHRSAVEAQAADAGLALTQRVAMPSNNLLLVFGRTGF